MPSGGPRHGPDLAKVRWLAAAELPPVPAHARAGRAQRLAALWIPVVLPLDRLVDRLVFARHVLRIGRAPELLKGGTYGHVWPDFDDSTRAAIEAVMAARAGCLRTAAGEA